MWLAMSLKTESEVSVNGGQATVKLPISGMADGCIGCLLVFETREAAAKYAGAGGKIVQADYDGG